MELSPEDAELKAGILQKLEKFQSALGKIVVSDDRILNLQLDLFNLVRP